MSCSFKTISFSFGEISFASHWNVFWNISTEEHRPTEFLVNKVLHQIALSRLLTLLLKTKNKKGGTSSNKPNNESSLSLCSFIMAPAKAICVRLSVCLSACLRSGDRLHERVNTSGCGADTDKQIAAHTSLGAHLQTAAGNLLTSVAPIRHASAYLCPPYQTWALGKLTSHAVMNLPIISSPITFHDLFLAIITSGFGRNKPKNLGYLSHGKLSQVYPFLR